jgi:hypothetical protein
MFNVYFQSDVTMDVTTKYSKNYLFRKNDFRSSFNNGSFNSIFNEPYQRKRNLC